MSSLDEKKWFSAINQIDYHFFHLGWYKPSLLKPEFRSRSIFGGYGSETLILFVLS